MSWNYRTKLLKSRKKEKERKKAMVLRHVQMKCALLIVGKVLDFAYKYVEKIYPTYAKQSHIFIRTHQHKDGTPVSAGVERLFVRHI